MRRRSFLASSTAAGLSLTAGCMPSNANQGAGSAGRPGAASAPARKLTPPADEAIPVAFVISKYATVIDFCGPWETFQDVMIGDKMPFELYTVSHSTEPIVASGGLKIVPDYSFEKAPMPKVVVVPAQGGADETTFAWLRKVTETTDVTMSVCTGAFVLGKAGLLSGRPATTHHEFLDRFEKAFPDVKVQRGVRFVEGDKISTAAGLTSGVDLALRVVERYFGREAAQRTADYMEYQGKGWLG